jgi:hypothetical protein
MQALPTPALVFYAASLVMVLGAWLCRDPSRTHSAMAGTVLFYAGIATITGTLGQRGLALASALPAATSLTLLGRSLRDRRSPPTAEGDAPSHGWSLPVVRVAILAYVHWRMLRALPLAVGAMPKLVGHFHYASAAAFASFAGLCILFARPRPIAGVIGCGALASAIAIAASAACKFGAAQRDVLTLAYVAFLGTVLLGLSGLVFAAPRSIREEA